MALTVVKASGIDVTGNYTVNGMTVSANLISGNASLGNLASATYFSGNGYLLTGVTATTAQTVTTNAQPNITSLGTLSSVSISGITTATGGVKTANILDTAGTITLQTRYGSQSGDVGVTGNLTVGTGGSGNVTATYFIGNGSQLTGLPASYSNANVALYLPTYTGNLTAGNATFTGNVSAGNISTTGSGGNISGANYVIANYFSGNGSTLTHINASNIDGQIANSLVSGTVYSNAQPNITSVGTLSSLVVSTTANVGTLNATDVAVSGNTVIAGNLTVSGATEYTNVTNLYIKDPMIEIGGSANAGALSSNDAKDRGTLLHYYTSAPVDAFMGWDNSNGEFAFGSNVSVTSEVVTFNQLGNVRAGYFIGDGSQLTGLPASYANSNVAAYLPTHTGNVSASYFIGNVSATTGTIGTLSVTGIATVTGGVKTANIFDASGTITIQTKYNSVSGDVGIIGNLTVGTGGAGNLTATNVYGTARTVDQPYITSVGTLTSLASTGNVNFISASNVSLGAVSHVHITGGTSGQYLQTDGTGNLVWADTSSSSVTYTANSLSLTNGVYVSGNLASIQTFGDYADANGAYVLTDGTGSAPAWHFDVDFISVSSFNRVVMNINYTQSSGHTVYVQLYNNSTATWDSIGTYTGLGSYYAFALEVISDTNYKDGSNKVLLRLYHSNSGNSAHQTSIDYVALQQSNQGPQGPRGPSGAAGNSVITDNTTANATYYPIYATSSSGNLSVAGITTTKLTFNPSSGQLTVQDLNTLSDATLKTNAEVINDPMAILSQIFGMGFNWADSGKKSYGVMAQMLEKILPELVTVGPDGKKSVNYIPIIAFLVEAVKKQQSDIEDLKKR